MRFCLNNYLNPRCFSHMNIAIHHAVYSNQDLMITKSDSITCTTSLHPSASPLKWRDTLLGFGCNDWRFWYSFTDLLRIIIGTAYYLVSPHTLFHFSHSIPQFTIIIDINGRDFFKHGLVTSLSIRPLYAPGKTIAEYWKLSDLVFQLRSALS